MDEKTITDYTLEIQKFFIEIMISEPACFTRVQSIYNVENFDKPLRKAADFLIKHAEEYNSVPTFQQIKTVCSTELAKVTDLNESHLEWFFSEFEKFTRRKELQRAILRSADLLEKGDYEPVEKIIKDAVQIGLIKDIGLDYWGNPRERLQSLRDKNGQISTGYPKLDKLLFGGWNRGELEILAAPSGGGKSLMMQNFAVNWLFAGLNGIYFTLELSEELCAMRMDSMISGISTREVFKSLDDLELTLRMKQKSAGKFNLKFFPAGSVVNKLRSYLKEYQVQTGIKPDFVMVDYLDLLMPSSVKVNPSDVFIKDKYVSEELRNMAKEWNFILVTASQFNRTVQDEMEFNHSHISGGKSKIDTCDNFVGIYNDLAMRNRGKIQLQLLKTRNSSGVGHKVELDYNIDTLRIENGEDDEYQQNATDITSSIQAKIKRASSVLKSTEIVTEDGEIIDSSATVKPDIKSASLKQLLNKIKTSDD